MAVHQAQGLPDFDTRQTKGFQIRFLQHLSGRFADQRLGKGPAWREREVADAKLPLRVVKPVLSLSAEIDRPMVA